ncbi:MAG: hypothetical protein JJE13_12040 [Thermoleophilia bacterium]|nr:hypothetical protein [Thermoleophilia bacterium]
MDKTMTFSNFLRNSGEAVEAAEQGDLLLERRDGPDLVLKWADKEASEREGMSSAITLVSYFSKILAEERPDDVQGVFTESFPWLIVLPPEDQKEFAGELVKTMRVAGELDRPDLVGVLVKQWMNTAEVWADPALRERLLSDVEVLDEIPSPERKTKTD